ncbi:MAG: hypothetical protein WCP39_07330 [Chlamydiota bacterium]
MIAMDLPESVHTMPYFVTERYATPMFAGIIKIPTQQTDPKLPYSKLICTEKDRETIRRILETLGTHGEMYLLKHRKEVEGWGDTVRHVHPLKFLGCVFSHPSGRVWMKDVKDDFFKWFNFGSEMATALNNEYNRGRILQYINDFGAEIRLSPEKMRPFVERKDWKGLIVFICYNEDAPVAIFHDIEGTLELLVNFY